MSGSQDGENRDGGGVGGSEDSCAFLSGGARGENVVNENEMTARYLLLRGAELEGFTKIFEALFSGKSGLPFGGADALESRKELEVELFGKRLGDDLGLVESTRA